MTDLTPDEKLVMDHYRRVRTHRWGEVNIKIEDGKISSLKIGENTDPSILKEIRRLKESNGAIDAA